MTSVSHDYEPGVLLRGVGLRVTAPRVISKALAARLYSTTAEIAELVRDSLGMVSTQAVYDVLRICRRQPVRRIAFQSLRFREVSR
ncbi:MAG: hypothetical protein ACRDTK_03075 [Mycobacterium sp.]